MTQARFEVIDVETGKTVATLAPEEWHEMLAAWELLDALEQAVQALNTAPRFSVPHLDTDSYRIAIVCDHAIRKAKGGAS
jgi:hypothetical protein